MMRQVTDVNDVLVPRVKQKQADRKHYPVVSSVLHNIANW